MHRLLFGFLLVTALVAVPVFANEKWDAFNGYTHGLEQDELPTQLKVSDIIKTLQASPKTVGELLDDVNLALESGKITEHARLAKNLRAALESALAKGFGAAKLDHWNYKYVSGSCGQHIIYYATAIQADKKNLLVGFFLSAEPGIILGHTSAKDLRLECY